MKPLLSAFAFTAALLPGSVAASAPIQKSAYACYVFYSPGMPTYTGRSVKVVSSTKYSYFNGKRSKVGSYKHGKGAKVAFRSGPLKGKSATHKIYGNGTHGLDIAMTPGVGGKYACSGP